MADQTSQDPIRLTTDATGALQPIIIQVPTQIPPKKSRVDISTVILAVGVSAVLTVLFSYYVVSTFLEEYGHKTKRHQAEYDNLSEQVQKMDARLTRTEAQNE